MPRRSPAISAGSRARFVPDLPTEAPPALGRATTLLLAVAAGLAVANVYYAQPLLGAIRHDLHIGGAVIGIVITVTQIGYGLGLFLVAPLGDLVDRRRLIIGQMLLVALALAAVAFARSGVMLLGAMAVAGLLAVVAQVIVAHAASLAAPEQRGRIVGTVTTGIVMGILLARTVSGFLSDLCGWRSVYLVSAAASLAVAGLLAAALPGQHKAVVAIPYGRLVTSFFTLFVELPILRIRATLAALIFFSITVLLTPLALALSAEPYALSQTQIGLFGLAGAAGALGAASAGRLADRGFAQHVTGIALGLMLLAWLPIAALQRSLWGLVVGVLVIDYGLQTVHVANQTLIYRVRPDAQTRLAAGYMIFYSLGCSAGSILSTLAFARYGWLGVCALGAGGSATAIFFWAVTKDAPEFDSRAGVIPDESEMADRA